MRVLSLTCSSSGCERNWSAFEMVYSKRRNRLHPQRMNDIVYVVYVMNNLKLSWRQEKKLKETMSLINGGGGDDEFFHGAVRDQFGGQGDLGDDGCFDFEDENDNQSPFVIVD